MAQLPHIRREGQNLLEYGYDTPTERRWERLLGGRASGHSMRDAGSDRGAGLSHLARCARGVQRDMSAWGRHS